MIEKLSFAKLGYRENKNTAAVFHCPFCGENATFVVETINRKYKCISGNCIQDPNWGSLDQLKDRLYKTGFLSEPILSLVTEKEIYAEIEEARRFTDTGNADRIVRELNKNTRYVQGLGWIHYENGIWSTGDNEGLGAIKKGKDALYKSIAKELLVESYTNREKLSKHLVKSQSCKAINDSVKLAKSELELPIRRLDSIENRYLFNVQNGTINLETGKIKTHSASDFLTQKSDASFNPGAKSNRWQQFLDSSIGDKEIIEYLQMAVGYTLSGSSEEQKFFFLYGTGDNGKSVFVNVISALLGTYAEKLPIESLTAHKIQNDNGNNPSPYLAKLRGKRAAFATETSEGSRWNESIIKNVTSIDAITARLLHKNPISFIPTHTLWVYGNHEPRIIGTDYGIQKRIIKIPFTKTIPKEKIIRGLDQIIVKEELSGVLNWAIEGFQKWQKLKKGEGSKGLDNIPEVIRKATTHYIDSNNLVKNWMKECLETNSAEELPENLQFKRPTKATKSDTYKSFQSWLISEGYSNFTYTKQKFGQQLLEQCSSWLEEIRGSGGVRCWKGIQLRNRYD